MLRAAIFPQGQIEKLVWNFPAVSNAVPYLVQLFQNILHCDSYGYVSNQPHGRIVLRGINRSVLADEPFDPLNCNKAVSVSLVFASEYRFKRGAPQAVLSLPMPLLKVPRIVKLNGHSELPKWATHGL